LYAFYNAGNTCWIPYDWDRFDDSFR